MLRGASPSVRTFASLAMPTTSQGGIVFAPPHQPADGVSVGPAGPGHGLADDDHGLGVRAVGVVEVAPAEDLDAYHLEELRLDRRPVCDEGAVVCRRLEPVDVELARARAERVQVQVADGADRLDAGERPEAIQQAPRVDARLVALALLTAGRELDPDPWGLETKTMDRHLALMRLPQQLSAFACRRSGCWRWHWPRSASTAWSATASPGGRARLASAWRSAPTAPASSGCSARVASSLVVIGGALGLTLAVVATRLLGGLLFEVDALDPLTFVGVPLVLGAAALLAAYLPARRASRVNPVAALRTD